MIQLPLYRKFHTAVNNHKHQDKRENRYDKDNHMTAKYLQSIATEQCPYCHCEMNYTNKGTKRLPNQVTIQRINNTLGHTIGNIVLCCYHCNVIKKAEYINERMNDFEEDKLYSKGDIQRILFNHL